MLSLLQEAGIKAYGVDASPEAVRLCRERGIEAFAGNGAEYLASLPDAFLGGIFGAHVIEHMEPREAMRFLGESHRVLKPGSALVLVTPNPADLRTTERFWLDITHVRPYPRKLLVALLERQGFHGIRCTEDREPARNALERIAKTIARVWFLGLIFRGDLVVVARR
jgi:SAM-dependent methyltransferase